jgi:hypothetical protein
MMDEATSLSAVVGKKSYRVNAEIASNRGDESIETYRYSKEGNNRTSKGSYTRLGVSPVNNKKTIWNAQAN